MKTRLLAILVLAMGISACSWDIQGGVSYGGTSLNVGVIRGKNVVRFETDAKQMVGYLSR